MGCKTDNIEYRMHIDQGVHLDINLVDPYALEFKGLIKMESRCLCTLGSDLFSNNKFMCLTR